MYPLKSTVNTVLRSLSTHPRKRLSQNFMVNPRALEAIAGALELKEGDTVLEIGAGLGFLTEHLARSGARVLAVEKDRRFCEYLRKRFAAQANIEVMESDVLKFDFGKLKGLAKLKCAGNIPYQITSPLLELLTRHRTFFERVVLTMQKEVARRLVAKEGLKERSALSVWMQLHARMKVLKNFGRGDFYPSPKVASSLILLEFMEAPLYPADMEETLYACVHLAFQKRRKTLLNAIAETELGLNKDKTRRAIDAAKLDPAMRPEELTLEEWIALGCCVSKNIEL